MAMVKFQPPVIIRIMPAALTKKIREIPGVATLAEGNGEMPKLHIKTEWSACELYLHGAHVTHFQKKGEPPVLFMSQFSRFEKGTPIRGGIPVIFPWFGPREGEPAHGFARSQSWELEEILQLPDGRVSVRLHLPDSPGAALFPKFTTLYTCLLYTSPSPRDRQK